MVSTPSAAAQAGEMERRRKQTMEKAKANHLSRQLQMRLQYARLKVEHGWQRQNLNEVENLYFHHSHQRGPKVYPPSSSLLVITQSDSSSFSSPSKFSDPSYKTWLHSLARSSTLDTFLDNGLAQENSANASSAIPAPTSSQTLQSTPTVSSSLLAPAEVHTTQNPFTQTPTMSFQPLQNKNSAVDNTSLSNFLSTAAPSSALPNGTLVPSPSSQTPTSPSSLTNNANNANLSPIPAAALVSASKAKKLSGRSQSSHKNTIPLTPKDMFNFNTSSLTYDSFWSGLQSKSYPGSKNSTATNGTEHGIGVGTTSLHSSSGPALTLSTSSPLPSDTQPLPNPTSSAPTSVSTPGSNLSMSPSVPTLTPMPAFIMYMNSPAQAQNRLLDSDVGGWNFGSPGTANLIPASLLVNPTAFPFLANFGAPYSGSFSTGEGQPHIPGVVVGVNTGSVGVTSTTSTSPGPGSAVVAAFVGQQQS